MGEDLCDQSYRAQAVWLWPLIHPSASTQDQKSKQVWGQMSSQEILNADLWLAKTILILKAACGCFFLIKTTHPPVSTHHFVSHHSCCLYHYHTAAPKSQLCPGEIEISTRWNLHLSSSPHLKLLLWYRLIWGLQEGQESSLSLLLQPGWCWWPHICSTQMWKFFLLQLDLYCTSAQLWAASYAAMAHTRRDIHLRHSGHPHMMVQQNTFSSKIASVLCKVAQPQIWHSPSWIWSDNLNQELLSS